MSWPNKLYVATKTLGVYYTSDFSDPNTQPTWTAVNGGLPATDVRQFALDPFNQAGKQYLLLETARTLYRRDNGDSWAAILTDAQADTLFSTVGVISFFCTDVTLAGRLWVAYLEQIGNGSNAWAAYSDDYGATWTAVTRVTDDNLDFVGGVGGIQASGDNVWVNVTRQSGGGVRCSINKGSTWPAEGQGAEFAAHNPLLSTLVYTSRGDTGNLYSVSNAGTSTLLDGAGIGEYDQMWFAAATANHQRAIIGGKLYVTSDGWTTKNTPSAIAPAPLSIAPWAGADEDNIIVGLTLDTDPAGGLQPHVIGVLYGEDDVTAVGIAGTLCDTSPYTSSIPMTCGGAAIGGIVAVEQTPSEGPVPPTDNPPYITPPGGSPVVLSGTANVQAVTMPGYTGTARGEPLPGDRGAFMVDTDAHAALHASDILAAAPTRHNPTPVGNTGKAPVSDGAKYVATDVLTPAEHTAIGDDAPHHAAVTLAASADAIMDLTGQAISLETETANTVLAGPASGAAAVPDFRALTNADLPDPLAFKTAASALTIASGAVTATQNLHTITSESGTTDDLATITAAADRTLLLLQATATHTITVKHGTGNISLNGAVDFVLTGNKALLLFWDGTKWVDLGAGGGGGAALTVKEIDGTPSVASVGEIRVTNGTLTDVGSGVVQLDFGSAATDGAAIHDNEAGEIHAITSKATPISADELVIEDSAASWAKKRVAISTLPTGGVPADIILTNAYASRPAAGTAGRIFLPNNGFYLERDTGTAWTPWGPIFPMTPPVSGDFAWVNQGSASITTTYGGVYMIVPYGSSPNHRFMKKSAPSTPYIITAAILPGGHGVNYNRCGLYFRQSSDGKLNSFGMVYAGGWIIESVKWNSETSYNAGYKSIGIPLSGILWLRIADDGTNRICSWSPDGQNWEIIHSVGRTDFLTADEVGFGCCSENGTWGASMTLLSWKES